MHSEMQMGTGEQQHFNIIFVLISGSSSEDSPKLHNSQKEGSDVENRRFRKVLC